MSKDLLVFPSKSSSTPDSLATWGRAAVVLMLAGAIIGPLLDGAHTHTDTARYTKPVFWLMAWWTPLIFAAASLATGLAYPLMERLLKRQTPPLSATTVALANALFYFYYLMSAYLPTDNYGKTIVLAVLWGVLWFAFDRTLIGIVMSASTALCGPLVEASLAWIDVYHYVTPNLYSVPSWLPLLYASAAIGNGFLGKALVDRK
jgi:hypothetical protein